MQTNRTTASETESFICMHLTGKHFKRSYLAPELVEENTQFAWCSFCEELRLHYEVRELPYGIPDFMVRIPTDQYEKLIHGLRKRRAKPQTPCCDNSVEK